MKDNAAVLVGAVVALLTAIFNCLVVLGLVGPLTPESQAAILAVINAAAVIVGSFIVRSAVYSERSAELVAASAYRLGQSPTMAVERSIPPPTAETALRQAHINATPDDLARIGGD